MSIVRYKTYGKKISSYSTPDQYATSSDVCTRDSSTESTLCQYTTSTQTTCATTPTTCASTTTQSCCPSISIPCYEPYYCKSSSISPPKCCNLNASCYYLKRDQPPAGVIIIPGSGTLFEFPQTTVGSDVLDNGQSQIDYFRNLNICPRGYRNTLCFGECCEFANGRRINFINGDLVIRDSTTPPVPQCVALSQNVGSLGNDLNDIFPNLLGVNGSIYIAGTLYRRITGFERLRFVAGGIYIINNPNLIEIPSFPSLLTVNKQVYPFVPAVPPTTPEIPAECRPGTIVIANNPLLRKIHGFEVLRQVKTGIYISQNACLTDVCGFNYLYQTNNLVFELNPSLTRVKGFDSLINVYYGLLFLSNNLNGNSPLLIDAFKKFEFGLTIAFVGNRGITRIENILSRWAQNLIFRSNLGLEIIDLPNYEVVNLLIENNPNLKIIKFDKLTKANGCIWTNNNASLELLETFNEVEYVNGTIRIADNARLQKVHILDKAKFIGGGCVRYEVAPTPSCVQCTTPPLFDWNLITTTGCVIVNPFTPLVYRYINGRPIPIDFCQYILPETFWRLLCRTSTGCTPPPVGEQFIRLIYSSIIIYGNYQLKSVEIARSARHLEASVYVVNNASLLYLNAAENAVWLMDFWVRNNPSLRSVHLSQDCMFSLRDLTILDSPCLADLTISPTIKFAQRGALDVQSQQVAQRALPNGLRSVYAYALYYSFDDDCEKEKRKDDCEKEKRKDDCEKEKRKDDCYSKPEPYSKKKKDEYDDRDRFVKRW